MTTLEPYLEALRSGCAVWRLRRAPRKSDGVRRSDHGEPHRLSVLRQQHAHLVSRGAQSGSETEVPGDQGHSPRGLAPSMSSIIGRCRTEGAAPNRVGGTSSEEWRLGLHEHARRALFLSTDSLRAVDRFRKKSPELFRIRLHRNGHRPHGSASMRAPDQPWRQPGPGIELVRVNEAEFTLPLRD